LTMWSCLKKCDISHTRLRTYLQIYTPFY
jgi:hypothetical protein